jgi:putative ABC transport system permease protein
VGRARLTIMAGQVAIACVLLVGASLLGRSFLALLTTDRGYDPSGVITARLSLPGSIYTPERRYMVAEAVLARLAGMPAVADAAFTSESPLTAGGSTAAFTLRRPGSSITAQASPRIVSPRFFSALGMRIQSGRGFNGEDTQASAPVVVVNRGFARRYLDDDALGARLPMGVGYQSPDTEATVIGVVDDVRPLAAAEVTQPEMYYSFLQLKGQLPVPSVTLFLRARGDAAPLATGIRTAIREVDRTLVSESVMTMEDRMLIGLARPRLYMILLGGFAFFALLVAAVGLFGVLSHTVAQRSREIAVRSALGARPSDIVRLVVGQGLAITAAGVILGLSAATMLAKSMSTFLYGVTPYDRLTFVVVPLLLLGVAAVACLAPARRAARMDPVHVLRKAC